MISDAEFAGATETAECVACAPILWITGLSGAGKSTLALGLAQALRRQGQRPLLLDGDGVRTVLENAANDVDHSSPLRLQRAWRLARLARLAALQGVPVIVATISLIHAVQAWSRGGPVPYAEVLMMANMEQLRTQKPALYGTRNAAAVANVVGLDILAEYPTTPELVLQQRFDANDLPTHLDLALKLWASLLPQISS